MMAPKRDRRPTTDRVDPKSGGASLRPGDRRDEIVAIVALLRAGLVTDERLAGAIDELGSAVDVLERANRGELTEVGGQTVLPGGVGEQLIAGAERDVIEWERLELDVRSVLDQSYPANLQSIVNKPPLVFVDGQLDPDRDERAVAVVGTRTASSEGMRRATRLSHDLVGAGYTVVSGMAKGIDTAAHSAALAAHGRTIAVMGTGIDRRYPKENTGLADQIISSGGALVTQFLPGSGPLRWHFPKRNIVMSGLSIATVVVEAGETSGAKTQAREALRHGRAVFLPRSLVQSQAWARRYVEQGAYGTRAVEIASPERLLERLDPASLNRMQLLAI